MLDHTAQRIFATIPEKDFEKCDGNFTLHSKWGVDGASGQNEFQQKFLQDNSKFSDSNLFMTSMVPIQINMKNSQNEIFWKNSTPSSTQYCRVLHFQLRRETTELIQEETERVKQEIKELLPTKIVIGTKTFCIFHEMHFTMLDGKVAQAVTETSSSMTCFICGAKPSEMNDLAHVCTKPVNENALKLGMSPLHARIKLMEYVLHIAYNMDFQQWKKNKDTKDIQEATKARIQKDFYDKLGLKIDMVKQGSGNTNTGNVSRRFFADPALTASITKVDQNLITRLAVILELISCNYAIDAEKFGKYAKDTADIAVALYRWYNLPPTVHKILIHGKEIIECAVLPIGALSEEAQESRNKDYKNFRMNHGRKCSRLATNQDIMNQFLVSSDPYITFLRPTAKAKYLPVSDAAAEMILTA